MGQDGTTLRRLKDIFNLRYGMIRPSEIMEMKITDTDEGNDTSNYINVVSKKKVNNNHKNDRKGPKIINITDQNEWYSMERIR